MILLVTVVGVFVRFSCAATQPYTTNSYSLLQVALTDFG
jgi:hypothetical protein